MNRFRRRRIRRKAARLARALAALEEQVHIVQPNPRPAGRFLLGPR